MKDRLCVAGGAHAQGHPGGAGGGVRHAAAAAGGGRGGRRAGRGAGRAGRLGAGPRPRGPPRDSWRRGGPVGRRQLPHAHAALPASKPVREFIAILLGLIVVDNESVLK